MLDCAVSKLYDGEWEGSVIHSFRAARTHLVALVLSKGGEPGNGGLAKLLRWLERSNGKKLPPGLLEQSRKLDRMYLQVKRGAVSTLGWQDYPDEEQCCTMIHYARMIIKYCRITLNRTNSEDSHEDMLGES